MTLITLGINPIYLELVTALIHQLKNRALKGYQKYELHHIFAPF